MEFIETVSILKVFGRFSQPSAAFYSYLDSGIGTNFILWLLQLVHLQRRCFSFVKKGVFFFFKAFSGLGFFLSFKKNSPHLFQDDFEHK